MSNNLMTLSRDSILRVLLGWGMVPFLGCGSALAAGPTCTPAFSNPLNIASSGPGGPAGDTEPRKYMFASTISLTPPTFSHPLDIDNPYHPFVRGAMKVFSGHKEGARTVIVDLYLTSTRTFDVDGEDVATRILQETEFEDGALTEVSLNFFAQADDGTVYYFGEAVDEYENGVIAGHEGSWLVGGPTASTDPPQAANASAPTVFMPAHLSIGLTYKPEDLPPVVDETDTVKDIDVTVEVPAGRFRNAVRVGETTSLGDPPETKWYAPGVGVLKGKTRGEGFVLTASTLTP